MYRCGAGKIADQYRRHGQIACGQTTYERIFEMASRRVALEMGMGTDIRGGDYTKAAVRALRDALWHSSLSITRALGLDSDAMHVVVTIGVPEPGEVDRDEVAAILPHGTGEVIVVHGGL